MYKRGAKISETEAFEQAWVGEAQRQGLADRFQVYARGNGGLEPAQ